MAAYGETGSRVAKIADLVRRGLWRAGWALIRMSSGPAVANPEEAGMGHGMMGWLEAAPERCRAELARDSSGPPLVDARWRDRGARSRCEIEVRGHRAAWADE